MTRQRLLVSIGITLTIVGMFIDPEVQPWALLIVAAPLTAMCVLVALRKWQAVQWLAWLGTVGTVWSAINTLTFGWDSGLLVAEAGFALVCIEFWWRTRAWAVRDAEQ